MKAKRLLRFALVAEFVIFWIVLLVSDRGCTEDCLNGLNNVVIYVLPIIGLTLLAYTYIKIDEIVSSKTALKSNHRVLYLFGAIVILFLILFGVYYLVST